MLSEHGSQLDNQVGARMYMPSYPLPQLLNFPEDLVNTMGPWLRDTKQGLWPHQLPSTEQTLGWLLYLAPEYHLCCL